MHNQPYINGEGHKVLEYLSNDTIVLKLPFIMTQGKRLTKGMPYLKVEKKTNGEDIAAIRLLNYQEYQGVIYLNVQDLKPIAVITFHTTWKLMGTGGSGRWLTSIP